MATDLAKGHDTLFKFQVAPPFLYAIGCTALDNHVDWVLFERATEEGSADVLLNHCDIGRSIKQWLKKAQELLILARVNCSVVVKDCKQD